MFASRSSFEKPEALGEVRADRVSVEVLDDGSALFDCGTDEMRMVVLPEPEAP